MASSRPRARRTAATARGGTVRQRVLSTMVAFMIAGLAVTGVLTYAAQFRALDQRVTAELWQEYDELALIAASQGEDGEPSHSTVDSVLITATDSAAPSDHESVLTLLDGEPLYEPRTQDFALLQPGSEDHDEVLRTLRESHQPGGTVVITMDAYGRDLRVLIASVTVAGDDAEGIFVVASDIGAQRRDLWQSVLTFSGLSVMTLLLAGGVGYAITGRLLRPLEDLRAATEQITVDDLEYRVPVPAQRDDIGALAQNFNRMLGRIQAGFAEQRRFMSDVGHELRTPLTIVRGTLETTDVEDVEDVRESRDIALEELDRMGRVVGDLSELAASKRPDYVRPRPLDMDAFARSAFARIEHIAEREWVLERRVDVVADADEQRLAQAVVQLAANAVRYSDEGSRIRFGVDRVLGERGPEIHVTVQDEGIGIDREDQRRIFERFTRVDGSRGGGSGLGLPIVLAIAEGHGGVVRLLSSPGRGSTFTIVFPQFTNSTAPADGVLARTDDRPDGPARDTDTRGTAPAEDRPTATRRNDG
ncbi:two-component sensor histidine kinase [Brachybacterium ginsengisoli]|uniref:histidine kinase n=1 Tax=Brachybacterium ginsengisoli TaxID=1331682 RepID=A0A291H2J2_9MICO|nr:ATP-binding protein [Brachybacterium ginsengisoli]ATG56673.1 two-component sensor histidine kinase [Brachybacterium ginsengisoli]